MIEQICLLLLMLKFFNLFIPSVHSLKKTYKQCQTENVSETYDDEYHGAPPISILILEFNNEMQHFMGNKTG